MSLFCIRPISTVYRNSQYFWNSSEFSFRCMCVCVCMCVVVQSCLTLCDPMDCSPPGSSLHGIFRARILEWVANSYSRGSCQTQVSNTRLFATEPPGKPLSFRYRFVIMIFQRGIFFSLAHRQMTAPDYFSPWKSPSPFAQCCSIGSSNKCPVGSMFCLCGV